jgi:hypothetical protein
MTAVFRSRTELSTVFAKEYVSEPARVGCKGRIYRSRRGTPKTSSRF